MGEYPKDVRVCDVVNSIFGPKLFRIKGGRITYDQVYMRDGGQGVYLVKVYPDLRTYRRYIYWDTPLEQMYEVR